LCFFFSSRRRHTRWPRDWSSDVCSSDLSPLARRLAERTGMPLVPDVGYPTPGSFGSWGGDRGLPVITYEFPLAATEILMRDHVRSEERRVGKEGRSRRWA